MKHILFLSFITISLAVNAQSNMVQSKEVTKFPSAETNKNVNYTYTIIPAANKTWCYDVYKEKRLFIHQPSAPGLPGKEGFKTKADAEKVAMLVIEKIKRGEMPPSVTIEEMKKIRVL
jgi:hypothetical protein